jgi:rhamnogalacturonan endolyase
LLLEQLESRTLLAFGITSSGGNYVVDNGAGLVFKVLQNGTSSTIHTADITSITYNGNELLAPYSTTSRYSHFEEGMSSSTTITTSVDNINGTAMIVASDPTVEGVTQYYIARRGYNTIYMATYCAGPSAPPPNGEARFIFYLDRSKFNVDPSSDIRGRTAIEGSDVFRDPATGYTYSKFYFPNRNIDDPYHGVTGPGIGAFMMIGSREKGSGGPFFKDIAFQGAGGEELYNVMYSGHEQTEAFRSGLQGPYALEITGGSGPAPVDYSFMDNLGITGWVPASGRGAVSGNASGVPVAYTATVGLANAAAQYWATPDASGSYTLGGILPGTYTETLYANELAVGSQSVTIAAGGTTPADISDTTILPNPIWRIGTWDGTPNEFLNEPALHTEHPSDSRMAPWNNVNYVIGGSTPSTWPAAQWKDINNDNRITFTLTSAQAAVANTLRIGITDAFANGRPQITVNSGQSYQWTSALPAPSSQPVSRSITRGTYRGNNAVFTYNIPRSALVAGTNTIDISVNSGDTTTGFLSPAIVYDAIDLRPTVQVPDHILLTAPSSVTAGATFSLTTTIQDAYNNTVTGYTGTVHFVASTGYTANYTFTAADMGTHTFSGLVLNRAGTLTVTGTDTVNPSLTGSTSFTVTPAAPDHIAVMLPSTISAGVPFALTVAVQDAYGNTVTGYGGTVHFTLDGPAMAMADYTFTAADMGSHTCSNLVLNQTGTYMLTGTDTTDPMLTGTIMFTVMQG